MITAKKIDHVCLQVSDLDRSKKYYETVFGATCWFREDNSKMLVVETKGFHLFLVESQADHAFLSNQHLSLQVNDLNEVISVLETLQIDDYQTGIIDFFEHENYRWCEWRDPDNIRLECVEPITNLKLSADHTPQATISPKVLAKPKSPQRKIINFTWNDEDAQAAFAEWCPFPDARSTSDDIDRIEEFAGITPPLRVLDVGCGNGRHSIEMAKRGYQVVGIDIAKRFLTEAKQNLADSRLDVEFRFQRASELLEVNAFDFALAYWHTIGFMSNEEIKRHFCAIYSALKPKASFLYVFQGPKLIPEQRSEISRNWNERNGRFILTDKSINDGYRDENCIVIDTNTGEVIEYREHQRAMGFDDVINYLKYAGFNSIETYTDFERTPATQEEFSIFLCGKQ